MSYLKRNKIFQSITNQSKNKFRTLMNSPNFGNQQILLQSCCFFDSGKSQTPHASHSLVKEFNQKKKIKFGSPHFSFSNKNIGRPLTKFHILGASNEENMNDSNINSSNEKQTIIRLKKHNKALKETIKNLTSQLDRVCDIALKAKYNGMTNIQNNNDKEQEKNILLNKIENSTKEKIFLKTEIDKKDEENKNYKINNKINEINNINQIKNKESRHKKFGTKMASESESIKQLNSSLSISVNREINENKKYKTIIDKLNQENESLRNKKEEEINILNEKLNSKEKRIQNLIHENVLLKYNTNNSKNNKLVHMELNGKDKEKNDLIKENLILSNKLIEAGKTISEYIQKYDEERKKYHDLKNNFKKLEKINQDLKLKLLNHENKDGKKFVDENNKLKGDYNLIQKNYEILKQEKNQINQNYNELLKSYNTIEVKLNENQETITKLKKDNDEYISDNTLLSKKYVELQSKKEEFEDENIELKTKILNYEKVNNELIKKVENINNNFYENQIDDELKNKKSDKIGNNCSEKIKLQYKMLFNNYNKIKLEYKKSEGEINLKKQYIFELEAKNKDLQNGFAELEEKYNNIMDDNEILSDNNNSYQNELIYRMKIRK